MDIIQKLTDKNDVQAHNYLLRLEGISAESDELYPLFDDFLRLTHHSSSFVRSRGFRLCCCQARWDRARKIESNLDEMLNMLDDDKPTAVRQCITALHVVLLYQPELLPKIKQKIANLCLDKYKDSMRPLIKKDIDELLEME